MKVVSQGITACNLACSVEKITINRHPHELQPVSVAVDAYAASGSSMPKLTTSLGNALMCKMGEAPKWHHVLPGETPYGCQFLMMPMVFVSCRFATPLARGSTSTYRFSQIPYQACPPRRIGFGSGYSPVKSIRTHNSGLVLTPRQETLMAESQRDHWQ